MSDFKDFFSAQSVDYAKFRPRYPAALFDWLAQTAPSKDLVWDVGTGNGQAAVALADRFRRVIGTDPSRKQLESAEMRRNITYQCAAADLSGLTPGSVDAVTVAQAFHWFNQPKFFLEVKRVAKPGAVLAVWCYALAEITPEVDRPVRYLYNDILGPHWDDARRLVEEGYSNENFPFTELEAPKFVMEADWNLAEWMGYLGTWSALQKYQQETGHDPRESVFYEIRSEWGVDEGKRRIRWPLSVRAFRVDR